MLTDARCPLWFGFLGMYLNPCQKCQETEGSIQEKEATDYEHKQDDEEGHPYVEHFLGLLCCWSSEQTKGCPFLSTPKGGGLLNEGLV
ncbi:hypothetical protein LCGC14_0232790 [marine sediment metagenome]|uniref:Uncharacterized protein n=1 Tax=marine sediment metagenome TaxID=412755 RepID=A0A0F9XEF7_9ZZZZ